MEKVIKINKITALTNMKLLVEFKNGVTKLYDAAKISSEYEFMKPLEDPDFFNKASVDYDGSGVIWNEDIDISEWELWNNGVEIPLTSNDLAQYLHNNTIGTTEACKILGCTRQNIDFLTKKQKLVPVMKLGNNKIFSKSDIMAYKNKADNIAYAEGFQG